MASKYIFACFFLFIVKLQANPTAVIGGTPVKEGEFEEVVRLNFSNPQGKNRCTATVVGPKVVFTAAHCLHSNEKEGSIEMYGTEIPGKFYSPGEYWDESPEAYRYDFALGISEVRLEVKPSAISFSPHADTPVTIVGFGCNRKPNSDPNENGDISYIKRFGHMSILNVEELMVFLGGDAGCYGDSGGPSFIQNNGKRELVAVTSRSNLVDRTWSTHFASDAIQNFIKNLIAKESLEICGFNLNC